ncbi:ATP-binding protein [uncultured Polaribacter sp.]|uniref:tetratricopeptide repeat-containing sensor histidine kinase n=1 Tax=uncultured Polaribacter sp. TaxID=174711 RepID=UPI002605B8C3|nr:ATP-binding protein [uncultured Polaribacter sp.]
MVLLFNNNFILYSQKGLNDEVQYIIENNANKKYIDSISNLINKKKNLKQIKYNCILSYYFYNKNLDTSLLYSQKALEIATTLGDKSTILDIQRSLIRIYKRKGDYTSAIFYTQEIIKDNYKTKDFNDLTLNYKILGNAYYNMGNYGQALKYLRKNFIYLKYSADSNRVANAYSIYGLILAEKNKIDSATFYVKKAIDINKNHGNKMTSRYYINNLGKIYYLNKDYIMALKYYNQSESLREKDDTPIVNIYNFYGKSEVYEKLNQYKLAIYNAEEGLKLSKEVGIKDQIKKGYYLLYQLHKKTKNFTQSIKDLELHNIYNDSINSFNLLNSVQSLNLNFNIREAELLRKNTEQKNKLLELDVKGKNNMLIIAILIISLLLILYSIKLRIKNIKIHKILDEKIKLENTIDRIEDSIAKDFHDNFGNRITSALSSYYIVKDFNKKDGSLPKEMVKFLDLIEKSLLPLSDDIKDLLWAINPYNNKLKALVEKLKSVAQEKNKIYDGEIVFITKNLSDNEFRLPKLTNRQILLIIKESLNNAIKYSKSERIEIILSNTTDRMVKIECKDYGIGFNIDNLKRVNGINHLKERSALIDFNINIKSEIRKGTSIILTSKHPMLLVVKKDDKVA